MFHFILLNTERRKMRQISERNRWMSGWFGMAVMDYTTGIGQLNRNIARSIRLSSFTIDYPFSISYHFDRKKNKKTIEKEGERQRERERAQGRKLKIKLFVQIMKCFYAYFFSFLTSCNHKNNGHR